MPRGIRRRLLTAFALLVAVTAGALWLALAANTEVIDLLEQVAEAERGIESALRLSEAVREQYAHQAHTIILNNHSHMHFYEGAQEEFVQALEIARGYARGPDDLETLAEIGRLGKEIDRNFRETILPDVGLDREALVEPHDRALGLVDRVVQSNDRLTRRFEARVARLRALARAAERGALWRTLVSLVLVVGVGAVVALYVDRSITGPVRNLEAGAQRLAKGDLTTRIPVDRDDELGELAQRFNEMAAELAVHQERLVQSEKLAGIGRLAAGVAHEINNPLAVIRGYAHLIARDGDPRVVADARLIAGEVERCEGIVGGLLDLARPARLLPTAVDLAQLVAEVAERLGETSALAGIELTCEGDPVVVADPGKVRQIITNLLRNAAEAAPGEKVRVAVLRERHLVRLRVRDRGPGLSEEARRRLFEPFFTTKARGTGLGLAVSEALARAHGGALSAPATGEPGACFELTLPFAVPA